MTNNPAPSPDTNEQVPRYSASEQPITRGYRIAFLVWKLAVLLTVVVALTFYLVDKLILK